ncbi:carbonic anhydrase [Corynebacterium genitalium ATCC 33030]|nr:MULTISPECIES: carbonic anhydrase [Corynebacterium]MCQ4619212.1 carbonic anhydrase [Corynebacterium pseudogenitalium]MCQ4621258.1 carbonic anhydrase [Corynebacterium sp. CCUG 71335]MCQ4623578.1 carbonic anhydrase [Corynebacterium sp. CCUG 70398]MCQ4625382.1 carbonic anhydrase [Corynebacterium sp. CCUG 69979]MCQ4627431.1 carbonic anhydrase [Corynebacterium sp. CCUG 65737]
MAFRKIPRETWQHLLEGNERFATETSERPNNNSARLQELRAGQEPYAAVLACSDSRVPVEMLFDAGLGELFVVRTAGGCVDAAVTGSLEFAVKNLGVSLIVVLSHESCGAIGAAATSFEEGEMPTDLTRVFVEKIAPSVIEAKKLEHADRAVIEETHATVTAEHLRHRIPDVEDRIADGSLGIVAARYRLEDGRVTPVGEHFGR